MTSGPGHYREAERLLAEAAGPERLMDDEPRLVWSANVHATLALAAATALRATDEAVTPDWVAWMDVAGEKP